MAQVGYKSTLEVSTDDTTYNEVGLARDIDVDMTTTEVDATSREEHTVKSVTHGLANHCYILNGMMRMAQVGPGPGMSLDSHSRNHWTMSR